MSQPLGIENDTTSLTNSSNKPIFNRFSHSLRLREIFDFYDKQLVKVKKGHTIRTVLGDKSHSTREKIAHKIFIKGMEIIANGVVNRRFIFQFPFKNLEVIFKIIKSTAAQSKGLFKYYRGKLDPFDMGFSTYRPVLKIKFPTRHDLFININLSQAMYQTMIENKLKGLTYENSKIYTITNIAEELEVLFPTLTKTSIVSVLRHGLNTIFKGLTRRCDSYINLDRDSNKFFMYFCGSHNVSQFDKVRAKTRFLLNNKKGKPPHDNNFYFYLTDDKKLQFENGEVIKVNCTRYLEELHKGKYLAKHIYKMHVPDLIKQGFFAEVHKDATNITYYEQYIDNHFTSIW